jgi:hypothetical protein
VAITEMWPVRLVATAGLSAGLQAHDRQRRVFCAQQVDGSRRGRVAGHHQRLDAVLGDQLPGHLARALDHIGIAALAIGRKGRIGEIHEAFVRQLGAQRGEHAEPADAAVENAYRRH